MISAGELNQRITLYDRVRDISEDGSEIGRDNGTEVRIWAAVAASGGTQNEDDADRKPSKSAVFTIRSRHWITEEWEIEWRGNRYQIDSITTIGSMHEEMEITAHTRGLTNE